MKFFRYFLFLLSLFTLTSSIYCQTINPADYQKQAEDWLISHVVDATGDLRISVQDLQLLANLAYFSFLRSKQTIESQNDATAILNVVWKGYQNIAQTRLDPSKELPYQINTADLLKIDDILLNAMQQHYDTNHTYDHAVKYVVDGDNLGTNEAQVAVADMRDQARDCITDSMVDIKEHLSELFKYANRSPEVKRSITDIMDFIWSYIPQLAVQSFIEADNLTTSVNEKSWDVLQKVIDTSNYTWRVIEVNRASFYLAFYRLLYNTLQAYSPAIDMTILFNAEGITNSQELLPDLS